MAVICGPGSIVHQEQPFAQVIYFSESAKFCDYCFRGAADFAKPGDFNIKACELCRAVGYCSKKCRKIAWKQHRLECPHLKNLPQERRDFIRLVGLVLLIIEGREWSSIKATVGGMHRSFADLVSNCHITKNIPKLSLHGLEMKRLVKEYLGDANKLDDDQLLELIGKVKHNRYGVQGKGCALYIGASIFEHSCVPTAVRSFDGATITVRANCDLNITDIHHQVTISYTRMVALEDTFTETKKSFYGPCQCWDCNIPYGESLLTSILDRTRAFSVIECTELALKKLSNYWETAGKEHEPSGGSCSQTQATPTGPKYYKGLFLDQNQYQALKMLLEMQENVLGDTNILRIRLLLAKAIFETHLTTKASDLLMIVQWIKMAFGDYSEELLFIYEGLGTTFLNLKNYQACATYNEKMIALSDLLYGKKSGRGR